MPVGTPVKAVTSGVLWRVGFQAVGGLELYIVGAGGRRYYYAHLSALEDGVESGVSVKAGQLLAYSGSTGMAHGVAHLHLGVCAEARQSALKASTHTYCCKRLEGRAKGHTQLRGDSSGCDSRN